MRALIHTAFNPSASGKALVSWLTGTAIRIINWLTGPGQRILIAAVALALVLQMVPLAPPPPSQMVTVLLADASPPVSSRAPFLAEALAPFDSVAPLFTTAPTPAIAAGAEVTKTVRSEVDQGQIITYTLVISQSSGSDWPADTVYVTDAIPANTGSAFGAPAGDWTYGTMGGVPAFINTSPVTQGMWITAGVLGVVTSKPLPDGTIISNNDYAVSATIRATGSPVTTEVRAPAFSINKTTSSSPVCAGSLLTYTISVSDTGRVTTVDPFTISDIVPSNVSFISASDGGSYDLATRAVIWTVNTPLLKNGGTTVQRTFVVSVPYTLTDGTSIQNITYTVFSNEVTPDGVGPSQVITVSRVTPDFSVSSPVCMGPPVTFINTSAGANAYLWDFGDGTPTSSMESPSHTYTSDGNYTVVLTATSDYGCPLSTTQQVVTVNPLSMPTLQISPTTAMACTTVYFTDTDTSDVVSRTWDFGNGESTTTAISTTSHSYDVTIGNYTVTLTSTTAGGCISSTQKMITITVGSPAFITVTADPPALPVGQTSLLTATVTDCGANPVADGTVITFTSSPDWSGVNPVTGMTSNGVATSTITGTMPGGTATVTATAPNLISGTTTVEFHVPDLGISKAIQPLTVVSSDTITYTLSYTNAGAAAAQSVYLTDTLPAGVTYGGLVSENPSRFGPPTYDSGPPETVTWFTSTLADGASGTIVITATVDFTDVVSAFFTNTVQITTTTPESDASNNIYQASNWLSQMADVTISKAVTPITPLQPGDRLTYTLTFTNQGYVVATGVVITDSYQPISLTNVISASGGAIVTPTAAVPPYTWEVQDLSYGEGGIITITAQVDPAQTWGWSTILTNTAYITTARPDGDGINNTDEVTSTIQMADVVVSKEVQRPTVVSSDAITYTLVYNNAGAAAAQGVCMTDTLPAGVTYGGLVSEDPNRFGPPTYDSGPPETVTWCTPTLASGASGTIVITATVDFTDVVSALFTNTVQITTTTPESDASNNIYQASNWLSQTADVTISKAVTPPTTLHPNDMITYTLTFTNVGYAKATGVVITDSYQPISLTNVISASGGAIVTPTAAVPPYTWEVQDLSYGEGGVITITAHVDPGQPWLPTPTTLTNTALITTTTTDGSAINDGAQVTSTVLPGPPHIVTYDVPANLPRCGQAVVTATVTDQWGNYVQDGTVVSLTCTSGLTFQESGGLFYYPLTRNGVVTATLVAGSFSGLSLTRAQAGAADSSWQLLNITDDIVLTSILVTANPNTLSADGSSNSVVTAVVTHCGGAASGVVVTFTISPALGTFPSTPYTATTNASGIATGTLTAGTSTGTATVTATADSLAATTPVTFTGVSSISVTADPDTLPANGSSTSTVTAMVTDTLGSPANGVVVTFTISPALGVFPSTPYTATTDASGIATGTLTAGTSTGTATVTATSDSLAATTPVTFITIPTGGDVYLPIVMRNWDPTKPAPTGDLVVTNIAFSPSPPGVGQTYHVTVTIQNTGTLTVTNDFWVDLYLNPDTSTGHPVPPTVNHIWPNYCPGGSWDPGEGCYGKAWYVTTDLAPGATLGLHTGQADVDGRYSDWPPPAYSSSHSPFYAQVDCWGYSYGLVSETDEGNNTYGPQVAGTAPAPMPAFSSGVPSPGSRPLGSREPRPTLQPRGEPAMTITPTPIPTSAPTATPSLPSSTPTPSPVPVPTFTPSAIPELGMTDTPTATPSPVPTTTATLPPEVTDTPTPTSTSTPNPILTADLSEQVGEPTPPDLPSVTPTTVPTLTLTPSPEAALVRKLCS